MIFYRAIVKHKLKSMSTKKNEIVGDFERGGFSSRSPYNKMFLEELSIRYDNGQNLILIIFIAIYKFIKNFRNFIK